MWFSADDYAKKGTHIKWNPAVKNAEDRTALWNALNDDRIDVLATDHAPHTLDEKQNPYTQAPSGGPLVQHALLALLTCVKKGKISLEKLVQKACHNPAILFQISKRGYIREGYYADLVLVDLNQTTTVKKKIYFINAVGLHLKGQLSKHQLKKHGSTEQWFTIKEKFWKQMRPCD